MKHTAEEMEDWVDSNPGLGKRKPRKKKDATGKGKNYFLSKKHAKQLSAKRKHNMWLKGSNYEG